jgi:hypothetical protein
MGDAEESSEGIRQRLSSRGEDAIGDVAQALLDNPYFNGALQAAFGARDKALGAQRVAMEALNLPSADDIERLNRRVRSLGERLEAMEDAIDRLEQRQGVEGS